MNLKEIKEMIKIMKENNLAEFELEREGFKIRLTRNNSNASGQSYMVERVNNAENAQMYTPQAVSAQGGVPSVEVAADSNLLEIKSPMVGTFYRAPSPDAAPFVEIGTAVEIGQVVCIIEAMKLMNEIKSEVKGKVVAITLENGDPIEFGQALFKIEPK